MLSPCSEQENSEEAQWLYPRKNPGKEVIKEMIGMVAQIGIRVLWETSFTILEEKPTYKERVAP